MPPLSKEEVRQIIKEELADFRKTERFTFEKLVQFLEGRNIQVGTATGTQIGTATGQKIALHGSTPIIQAASGDQDAVSLDLDVTGANTVDKSAIDANFTSVQTLVNRLRTDLINKGIIKGSA